MATGEDDLDRLRPADVGAGPRRDASAAGTVFLVMIGALGLAALLNAETMVRRVETSELGADRDVALAFWRPIEVISTSLGFSLPRAGLEALRTGGGPGDPAVATATGDDDGAVASGRPRPWPRGRLGHEPLEPAGPLVVRGLPPGADGAGGDSDGPVLGTPLGLPPPQASPAAGTAEAEVGVEAPAGQAASDTAPEAEPEPTPEPSPPGTTRFGLRRPTVEDPLRVLIIGDSTMDSVGNSMLRDLTATGVTSAQLDFRISTGLARPDYFDWPAYLREVTAANGTEVVVILIGANDAQPFIIGDGPENFGTELWLATYRQRVAALLDELTADGGWVVWIGQPVMRNPEFDAKMQVLNAIYAEEVGRYPTARFIDTRSVMADENGEYAAYLPDSIGDRQLVRMSDGVHMTSAGGDRLSPVIVEQLNAIAPLY